MNIVGSLVESYMYADMFNREYDGGTGVNLQEKIYVGGSPVEYILPSLQKHEGGKIDKNDGPFQNKVVPAGLVFIPAIKDAEFDYYADLYQEYNREVVPDSLYDKLIDSVSSHSLKKQKRSTPTKHSQNKTRTKKNKNE
jgi:hypothetical protein